MQKQNRLRFSRHALDRVSQRTDELAGEIGRLISESRVVVLQEEGTEVQHLLFYSSSHRCCLVAIYDPKVSEVITVAPLALSRPGSRSTTKQRKRAQRLSSGELEPPVRTEDYKIFVSVTAYPNGSFHHFDIARVTTQKKKSVDPSDVAGDKPFVAFLERRLNKILGKGDVLCGVAVEFENKTFNFPLSRLNLKEGVEKQA